MIEIKNRFALDYCSSNTDNPNELYILRKIEPDQFKPFAVLQYNAKDQKTNITTFEGLFQEYVCSYDDFKDFIYIMDFGTDFMVDRNKRS